MNWIWIDSDAALADLLQAQRGATEVAVDTEFRRRDTFYPQPALLQLCWSETAYLIDCKKITDLKAVRSLLLDEAVCKYLHSPSEDLEVFEYWLGVLPRPLFDTQRAAGLLGMEPGLSYRALVQHLLDIEIPKDETQSDWLHRPLTPAQCEYAALDVVHLLPVARRLRAQLAQRQRLQWVLEDGARMAPGGKGPLAKFKSAWKLDSAQRRVLSALVAWRDQRARDRDKPRSWIAQDKVLLALATEMPRSMAELGAVAGVPEPLVRRQGAALLALIDRTREDETQPDWQPSIPLSRDEKPRLRRLAATRDALATELNAAPEALIANRELELLLREAAGEAIVQPDGWSGWRRDTVIAPLRLQAAALVKETT